MEIFFNRSTLTAGIFETTGFQRRNASHFKGLISAKVELEAQGCDSTFTICHTLLKKAILHYKRALASFVLSTTVFTIYLSTLYYLAGKARLMVISITIVHTKVAPTGAHAVVPAFPSRAAAHRSG